MVCDHEWEGYFADLTPITLNTVEGVCTKCGELFTMKTALFDEVTLWGGKILYCVVCKKHINYPDLVQTGTHDGGPHTPYHGRCLRKISTLRRIWKK